MTLSNQVLEECLVTAIQRALDLKIGPSHEGMEPGDRRARSSLASAR